VTEYNPPGWLQNSGSTNTAQQLRSYVQTLSAGAISSGTLTGRGGVNMSIGNKLLVTQTGSPSMAVIVKSGCAMIPGSEAGSQGCYEVQNDADVTLSITAAHPTLPRIDIVCFKVQDAAFSGVTNSCSLVVVAGTPAGSPVAPSAPANSLVLANVAVAAAAASIVNANITDKRVQLAAVGGIIVCTSTTRPAAGTIPIGQAIYETDTNLLRTTPDGGTTWSGGPKGLIARSRRTTNQTSNSATEQGVIRFDDIPVVGGRVYAIYTSTLNMTPSVSGLTAEARLRITTDGSTPTNASTQVGDLLLEATATFVPANGGVLRTLYIASPGDVLSVFFGWVLAGGTGTVTLNGSSTKPVDLYVEDLGVDPGTGFATIL